MGTNGKYRLHQGFDTNKNHQNLQSAGVYGRSNHSTPLTVEGESGAI